VAPRNTTEQTLASIFGDILHLDAVGVYDNFFNLGGHSLLATQLISRIRQSFGVELPMRTVFEFPVIDSLAQSIVAEQARESHRPLTNIVPVSRDQNIPLSFFQERLWFVHQHMPEQRTSYNGTIGLRLTGELNIDALKAAFNDLVERHEILRTRFTDDNGNDEPMQVITEAEPLQISMEQGSEVDVMRIMDELAGYIYDLVNGPLFVVRILKLKNYQHVILIGMHHIIYDAWSQYNVMSRDVRVLYNSKLTGEQPGLPQLSIQYADYAMWQRSQSFEADLVYWKNALKDYKEGLDLPYDYPRPQSRTWHAATYSYNYPDELAQKFNDFILSHNATLFIGLLASFSIVLNQYTGREDLCIGTTTAGRNQIELEDLIGFFINILPLRIDLSGDPGVNELMQRTRHAVLDAFEHQALPFEHLLNALQKDRDSSQILLIPIVMRHQNFPTTVNDLWNDELEVEVIERDERSTPNEMDLQFFGDGSQLKVTVEYAAELFSRNTIARLIQHHQKAMEFLVNTMSPAEKTGHDNHHARRQQEEEYLDEQA
jgi:acyl carrier protein